MTVPSAAPPSRPVKRGYLIIADISGYTSFMTASELEHAQAIMEELTRLVVTHATAPVRLVKLEGDAIFCYIPEEDLTVADRLLDHVESCYFDFLDHLADMKRETTCPCAACANMQLLDLKFVVHYGEFIVQRVAGTAEDLAGPDVILVHRLLKNRVVEATGTRAYALLSETAARRVGDLPGLTSHSEQYESLGVVNGAIHDLRHAYSEMKEARRVKITAEEADVVHEGIIDAPPDLLWHYFLDPVKRFEWQGNTKGLDIKKNAAGRHGIGGETHCAHGGFRRISQIVDSRPFDYFTCSSRHKPAWLIPDGFATFEFTRLDAGRTKVSIRLRVNKRDPITVFMTRKVAPKMLQMEMDFRRLAALLAQRDNSVAHLPEAEGAR